MSLLQELWQGSGVAQIVIGQVVMILVCLGLLYLAIAKKFEPLLLVTIGFGGLLSNIPGVEILISIIFITLVGGISLSFFGRRILKLIDDLFKRIPFLRTVYSAIVQMTETFSKKDDNQKSVVLVEYPRKGVWAVGFATKENKGEMADKTNQRLINVFVPTTPNPTSGFLLMFPIDDVIYLNMTFEEASKFIVSAGTSSGKN